MMTLWKPSLVPHVQRGKMICDGLVGAWPFNEGSGNIAYNIAGNEGKHATWSGTGAHWGNSDSGNCGVFGGTAAADFLTVDDPDGFYSFESGLGFSLCARVSVDTGVTSARFVFDKRYQNDDGWYLAFQDDLMYAVAEGSAVIAVNTAFPADGLTKSVIATFHVGQGIRLYVDGVVTANTSSIGTPVVPSEPSLYFGCNDGVASFWDGKMSDLRIYNRALSHEEAIQIAAGLG